MTKMMIRALFLGLTFVLGACGASQFAQCKFDTDENGNVLKSSKDCSESGLSCQYFDAGDGLSGNLCNTAANPCDVNSNAYKFCAAKGQTCEVITLTDGSKGPKCVMIDPICKDNGNCPSGTTCVADGMGGKVCNTNPSTGVCTKHADCTAVQYCNFTSGACVPDHQIGEVCDIGSTIVTPKTPTPEQCVTNRCLSDLVCGCNTAADCGTGFLCNASFKCEVDPAQATMPWVKFDATIGNVTSPASGAKLVIFHNGSSADYYTASPYANKGQTTSVTLTFAQVCGTMSKVLTSATNGPGPASAANTIAGSAGTQQSGIELQACDFQGTTGMPFDSNCFAGVERGDTFRLKYMLTSVKVTGLGNNIGLGTKTIDLATGTYRQTTSTGAEGNRGLNPADVGCPR